MASNPTHSEPVALNQAMGINDAYSELKRPNGTVPFAINFNATGDVWDRREGRDWAFYYSGLTLGFYHFVFEDGVGMDGVQIGDTLYDFTSAIWNVMDTNKQLIIQSSALDYWNVSPNVDGEINPTVVATPATAAQTADFIVLNNMSFGFKFATKTVLMGIDRDDGIYTLSYEPAQGYQVLNDLVFSYASGKHFISEDKHGNRWKLEVDDDGTLRFSTI